MSPDLVLGRPVEGQDDARTAPRVKPRVSGVDVARGVALLGMMAVHAFEPFDGDGTPSAATVLAGGRSAATFALLAGVSVAFLSGGRRAAAGRARTAAGAGLAVRAVLIGLIGLLLGFIEPDVSVILAFYAVLFLLAIPLLGLRPRTLARLSVVVIALGPVLLVATADMDLPHTHSDNPTLVAVVTEPLGLLVQLLLTGAYPVVAYLAFLCAGLAVGRLDLTSRRVAAWLLAGGVALAVTARGVSAVLLHPLGGLDRLLAQSGQDDGPVSAGTALLWDPEQGSSWWYLALASPHAHTQLDVVHVLGSALAVLGAALLVTRSSTVDRLLRPLRAAGAMTLTLYTAHVLVLQTGVLEDHPAMQYLLLLVAPSLVFAVLWRRRRAQGPLEALVGRTADAARQAVLGSRAGTAGTGSDR